MTKNKPFHIVFSGGGTGGHLFPGLAVAEKLAASLPQMRITFCGSGKPFERKHVAQAGFDYFALPARPMPHGPREAVAFVIENLTSYLTARQFLRDEHVSAVVGLGGYASVPMARAAARRRVPLVLLEQNVVPGKATRWLARHATLVCTSYEETGEDLHCRCPIRVTGNPVRPGFTAQGSGVRGQGSEKVASGQWSEKVVSGQWSVASETNLPSPACGRGAGGEGGLQPERVASGQWSVASEEGSKSRNPEIPKSPISNPQSLAPNPLLLVLGGSGGARSLNENVPRALYKVRSQLSGWKIVHQSGESELDATQNLYAKLDLSATVVPFISDMPATLAAADLAVCRAGGTSLAELAVAGVPAILLPYPHATDDHQAINARAYSTGGGCVTIDEREAAGRLDDRMADLLCFLLANDSLRSQMSTAMLDMARPRAADDVAELIWSIVSSRSLRNELAAVA